MTFPTRQFGSPHVEKSKVHLVFAVNADWVFRIHFLPFAVLLRKKGWEVTVIARDTGDAEAIREKGIRFINWNVSRSGKNPFLEITSLFSLIAHYRRLLPDLVHHIGVKSICYGSVASWLLGIPAVNMFIGLGFVFRNDRGRAMRKLLELWFRMLKRDRLNCFIFQNVSDYDYARKHHWAQAEGCFVVGGVGVDLDSFRASGEPPAPPQVVLLASRMLWDKGVGEFVEAARVLKKKWGNEIRPILAGKIDEENPNAVPRRYLEQWQKEGVVEWLGFRYDMRPVLQASHIVVLPSYYGEGMPKVLQEAAVIGRALITTDWPGCRDMVRHGENGLLVPPRDSEALADAINYLMENPDIRLQLAKNAREMGEREFSVEVFTARMVKIYEGILR